MDQNKQGVMIALLPVVSDWCATELPHLTLVYAGKIGDLSESDHNNLLKDGLSVAAMSPALTLYVTGKEKFGEGEEEVDVLRFRLTPEIMAMRRFLEHWNASSYKTFAPHATVGPVGTDRYIPGAVAFDRLIISWGEDSTIVWLGQNRN